MTILNKVGYQNENIKEGQVDGVEVVTTNGTDVEGSVIVDPTSVVVVGIFLAPVSRWQLEGTPMPSSRRIRWRIPSTSA